MDAKIIECLKTLSNMTKKEALEHVIKTYGITKQQASRCYGKWQEQLREIGKKAKHNEVLSEFGLDPVNEAPVITYKVKDKAPELDNGWIRVPGTNHK